MKTSWRFKGEADSKGHWDEQAKIVVKAEIDEETWTATYIKQNEEPLCLARDHLDWGHVELFFYAKEDGSDELDEEINEDYREHYCEIKEQLDLYEHVPTYDDNMAGRQYCTGESLGRYSEWLVLERGFAYDI